jgi:hypothetical protein
MCWHSEEIIKAIQALTHLNEMAFLVVEAVGTQPLNLNTPLHITTTRQKEPSEMPAKIIRLPRMYYPARCTYLPSFRCVAHVFE